MHATVVRSKHDMNTIDASKHRLKLSW